MGNKLQEVWSVGLLTIPAELVELARKNKIPRTIVYNRVGEVGWSIERAVSIPVQKREKLGYTKTDLEQAEKNGIGRCTFISRVVRNWDMERAKTEMPAKRGKRAI